MNKSVFEQIKSVCDADRTEALVLEVRTRDTARALLMDPDSKEASEQAMLAVRHLEDARMRLGKVIQHLGDGISIYDQAKPNV